MHHVGMTFLVGQLQVAVEHRDGSMVGWFLAVGEQTLVLVDDHQVLILKHNVQVARFQPFFVARFFYRHLHSWLQRIIELAHTPAVDTYVVSQQLFHLASAAVGHLFQEELQ
jgi:hypothetical protein